MTTSHRNQEIIAALAFALTVCGAGLAPLPVLGLFGVLCLLMAFPACLVHLNTIQPKSDKQQRNIIGFVFSSLGVVLLIASCVVASIGLANNIVAVQRQLGVEFLAGVTWLPLIWASGPSLATLGARLMLGSESSRWKWLAIYWLSYLPASLALVGLMAWLNIPFTA
ncbi:MAG: hypothetical protein HY043_14105 [Verrucomicrobia bacterium]|nr:hypothetical protein [Verrucomicrobiota bacterium]